MRLFAQGTWIRLSVSTAVVLAACWGALAQEQQAQGQQGQEVENLGTFEFWTAWRGQDSNGVVCYVSSQPQDAQPTNVTRDPIHFLVVNRVGLGTRNEVQTLVGYPLAEGSTPEVTVDGRAFDMVVDGEAAWLASASDEPAFVEAMRAGTEMVVEARSQRGTNTADTYSLVGVTAAMDKLQEDCQN